MLLLSYGFLFMMLTFASKILADEPGSYKNKHVYAKMLKALIDINEKRVKAMNNLYALEHNNVEKILRSDPEMLESGKDSSQENNIIVLVLKQYPNFNKGVEATHFLDKTTRNHSSKEIPSISLEMAGSEDIGENPRVYLKMAESEDIVGKSPRVYLEMSESDDREGFEDSDINVNPILRRRKEKSWKVECNKQTEKKCRRACKAAYKNRRPMLRGSTFIQEHGGVGSEESLAIPTEFPKVSIIDYEIKPTKPEQHTEILNLPLNSEDPSVSHIDNGIVSVAYPEKENNPRVKLQLYEMDKDDKFTAIENIEDINITKEQSKLRRKNWRGSCDKNARRTCTKACRAAFKNSCKRYSCKSNIKKELKKECKSMCKAKFS